MFSNVKSLERPCHWVGSHSIQLDLNPKYGEVLSTFDDILQISFYVLPSMILIPDHNCWKSRGNQVKSLLRFSSSSSSIDHKL